MTPGVFTGLIRLTEAQYFNQVLFYINICPKAAFRGVKKEKKKKRKMVCCSVPMCVKTCKDVYTSIINFVNNVIFYLE